MAKRNTMIKLYSPDNEVELALIKSLLEGAQIPFFVHNEHFGSLYIGPQIKLFNRKMIMVAPEFEVSAKEVIADFLEKQETPIEQPIMQEQKVSIWDKIRMVLELLLFFCVDPGKRWSSKKKPSSNSINANRT
jgi:4-diphosphocytidyl-2C-methyl-D-erythritol kinase